MRQQVLTIKYIKELVNKGKNIQKVFDPIYNEISKPFQFEMEF